MPCTSHGVESMVQGIILHHLLSHSIQIFPMPFDTTYKPHVYVAYVIPTQQLTAVAPQCSLHA